MTAVQVRVEITHTYVGDLEVALEHDGELVILQSREGGSDNDLAKNFVVTTDLAGHERGGDWTLYVTDSAAGDVGSLTRWTIDLQ
jgi:subtilisin-like proprotein convertase family protein